MLLESDKYYHIYNRANGFENLFVNDGNYIFFIEKLKTYLLDISDIYAYCLMPNHFHLLIKLKSNNEFIKIIEDSKKEKYESYLQGFQNLEGMIDNYSIQQFSNLFNSYSKAFNKQQNRTGSLFQKGFKRKEIDNLTYLQEAVMYIHTNSVHHGFTDDFSSWSYSSFHELINYHNTFLKKEEVLKLFDDRKNFMFCHEEKNDFKKINKFLIE